MRAVVTGANGFLGAALVRTLLAAGDEVVAMIGPSGRLNGIAGLDVPTLQGDILDERFVVRSAEGADVIFHTATQYDFRNRLRGRDEDGGPGRSRPRDRRRTEGRTARRPDLVGAGAGVECVARGHRRGASGQARSV